MPVRAALGAVIKARRIEFGWTQEELAERISADGEYVRQSEISRIENGKVALPRRERLERLAVVLDLPLGELLARSGWAGAGEFFDRQAPGSANLHEPVADAPDDSWTPDRRSNLHERDQAAETQARTALRDAVRVMRAESERLSRNRRASEKIVQRFDHWCAHHAGAPWPEDYPEATDS